MLTATVEIFPILAATISVENKLVVTSVSIIPLLIATPTILPTTTGDPS